MERKKGPTVIQMMINKTKYKQKRQIEIDSYEYRYKILPQNRQGSDKLLVRSMIRQNTPIWIQCFWFGKKLQTI